MAILQPTQITKSATPWGHEVVWAKTDGYVGKLLHLNRGEAISRHYHTEKYETLYLILGTVLLTVVNGREVQVKTMVPSEAYEIPPLLIHWVKALEDAVVLEITTGLADEMVVFDGPRFSLGAVTL